MSEKTAKSKVDLENIKYEWSHKDHSYWFKYVGNYVWKVFDSDDKDIARIANDKGIRSIHPDTEISIRNNIIEEFTEFQMYPEYIMQFPLSDDEIDSITNVKSYEIILIGCCVLASRQRSESTEIGFQKAKRCIEWLRGTDFYTAPGSTKYHDAEESGLLKHTLRVFNHMLDLYKLEKFIIVKMLYW